MCSVRQVLKKYFPEKNLYRILCSDWYLKIGIINKIIQFALQQLSSKLLVVFYTKILLHNIL